MTDESESRKEFEASTPYDFQTWLTCVNGFKVGNQRSSYRVTDLQAAWNQGYLLCEHDQVKALQEKLDQAQAELAQIDELLTGHDAFKGLTNRTDKIFVACELTDELTRLRSLLEEAKQELEDEYSADKEVIEMSNQREAELTSLRSQSRSL